MHWSVSTFSTTNPVAIKESLAKIRLNKNGSLSESIYAALLRLAIDFTLLPNQFISEKDVAEGFAVSKTPVREAFIRLAEDGVVRVAPKSGTYVAPMDFAQAEEGFFIWGAIESSCAASLAEQRSLRNLGVLRDLLSNETAVALRGDFAEFRAAADVFYDAIFDLADFPLAKRLTMSARFQVDRIRSILHMYRLVPLDTILADHGGVVNAVAAGDGEAAETAMAAHIGRLSLIMKELAERADFRLFLEFLNQKRPAKRQPRSKEKTP